MKSPIDTNIALLADRCALIVGLGGLGCPAALALARAGIGELQLCDDDTVSETNLHRQILFQEHHVGMDKLAVAREQLLAQGARRVTLQHGRLLPENARDRVRGVDVVVEGADNFATKFLTADACHLESVPVVHGAAVRFVGTALLARAQGGPCYRCIFEDLLPNDQAPNCSAAGVMGPVVGVIGALMADLAIDALLGEWRRAGQILSFDGKQVRARSTAIAGRVDCNLCGALQANSIQCITRELYGATSVGPHQSSPS